MSIVSGALVVLVALGARIIADWQAHALLARFDAQDMVPMLVQQQLDALLFDRIVGGALGCLAIFGGLATIRNQALGSRLVIVTSALFILLAVWSFVSDGAIVGPFVRGVWWLVILMLALRVTAASVRH